MPVGSAGALVNASDVANTLIDIITYSASGTFVKATYPDAYKLRIRVQGAGGGGGGCQTNAAANASCGGGGEGGMYAESWVDIASLAASETVTVGAAGTGGGTGGTGNAGNGGNSSFGTLVVAAGGGGGLNGPTGSSSAMLQGGITVSPTITGTLQIPGDPASYGLRVGTAATQVFGGNGGRSVLGGAGQGGNNSGGTIGRGYGGGGGGASAIASTSGRSGMNGGAGVVIVEIYT